MPSHRNRETVALELLQNPEQFPSLPKRTEFERQLCLWRIPSFEPHSSWSIFHLKGSNDYFVRRLEHDPKMGLPANVDDPHVYGAEVPISAELAHEIMDLFETLQVPMFRRPAWVGLDGTLFGVRIGNFWQGTTVNWWSKFSPEWKPLNDLFASTISRLDALLPVSTLREIREP